MAYMKTFKQKLQAYIRAADITLEEAAADFQISTSHLSRLISAQRKPSLNVLLKIKQFIPDLRLEDFDDKSQELIQDS